MYTKLSKSEVENIVKEMRKQLPACNHGRNVKVYSEYTKTGEKILSMASHYDGTELSYCYDNPSPAKVQAFDEVYAMYCSDSNADSFSICSHNCQNFSVSWITDRCVIYITRKTEYYVVCSC